MICKVADADVEADELIWQTLGSNVPTSSTPRRVPTVGAVPTVPAARANRHLGGPGDQLDVTALKQRIADLESQRMAEVEQARKGGFEQGLKQARQEAATEMQDALDRLARTIQEVVQMKVKVRSQAENELVKLALSIARRILHREVTADPQALRGVVYAALQRLQNREITRIRVFPASVPAVKAALERNGGLASMEVVADGLLQPGGLLIETAVGELDASMETQLQEIERGFADRLQLR